MFNLNVQNRTVFHNDNLVVLRGINSESIDLIATDPPFNKGRDFHATPDSISAGAKFSDRWSWEKDIHQSWWEYIKDDWRGVYEVIDASWHSYGQDMAAFLCWMSVRLIEMHRILKPTGSIYLHCDPTASHYLKLILDSIFGRKNFRNEIVWKRSMGAKNSARRFHSEHDILLSYAKSNDFVWNGEYKPLTKEVEDKWYRWTDEDGRRYNVDNLQAPGASGYKYEFLGATRGWRYPEHKMHELIKEGRIIHKSLTKDSNRNVAGYKRYLDESKGALVGDIWTDIDMLQRGSKERTGYPTQKPVALYERIIAASSNEGDVVLDPFAGCATTLVAAEKLNRQWIGCDIWSGALDVVMGRMRNEGLLALPKSSDAPILTGEQIDELTVGEVIYRQAPPVRTDGDIEVVPYLQRVVKVSKMKWETLSHAEIRQHLSVAQEKGGSIVCAGCGRELEVEFMELDHIMPRSDGGSNDITNRILLCRPCNGKKSNALTLSGLIKDNKKSGWMRNIELAKWAAESARVRAEAVKVQIGI